MTAFKAHFDGRAIIPDEPVNLPTDTTLYILAGKKRPMTGKDLLESGLIGIWKDRTDIGDNIQFGRIAANPSKAYGVDKIEMQPRSTLSILTFSRPLLSILL